MRRNPQEIVLQMAHALTPFSKGEFVSFGELHRTTGLHYETIRSYGFLIDYIQTRMPRVMLDESGAEKGLVILDTPDMKTSIEEDVILYLFDKGAFKRGAAVEIPSWISEDEGKEILRKLMSNSLVEEYDGRIWLLADGIVKGAALADERQELASGPIREEMKRGRRGSKTEDNPEDRGKDESVPTTTDALGIEM